MLLLLVLFHLPHDGSWQQRVDDTLDYIQHFTGHLAEMQRGGRTLLAYVIMVLHTLFMWSVETDGDRIMLGVFQQQFLLHY